VAAEIDLYDIMRQVSEYCLKYDMNKRETNTINLICEEYLTNLMRRGKTNEKISISVRYNENDGSKELRFADSFAPENHLESENFDEISARLIKGYSKSVQYRLVDGQNVLELKLS
jgi:hypothetical protein